MSVEQSNCKNASIAAADAWLRPAVTELMAYGYQESELAVFVKLDQQCLYTVQHGKLQQQYPVSTSRYGAGQKQDSYQTPLGVHSIAEKIGAQCQRDEILRARVPTGEIALINTTSEHREQDLITSRILWLRGMQPGLNQGPGVDSYQRYIYIHGTAEEGLIGQPASIGCVRMRNADIIELYTQLNAGDLVNILQ